MDKERTKAKAATLEPVVGGGAGKERLQVESKQDQNMNASSFLLTRGVQGSQCRDRL